MSMENESPFHLQPCFQRSVLTFYLLSLALYLMCIFSVISVAKQWVLSFGSRKLKPIILKDNNETL